MKVFQAVDDAPSGWQMLQLAKLQTFPDVIYTNSRAELSFLEQLRQPYEALIGDDGCPQSVIPQVRLEKAAIFKYDQVMQRARSQHHKYIRMLFISNVDV